MRQSTKRSHFAALLEVRTLIGLGGNHSEEYVRHVCAIAYGKPINGRTWERWKARTLAIMDPPELGGRLSEASFLCLWTLAGLLRGNSQSSPRNQVSRLRLAQAVRLVLNGAPRSVPGPPQNVSYAELRRLAEMQAMRTYSDRYHRMQGLKKTRLYYTRTEALQILANYPDHRIQYVRNQQNG